MPGSSRILWLDAARAGLMLMGLVLHSANVFAEPSTWLVRNDRLDPGFSVLVWVIHSFRMPAFFIIAGFFCAYSHHRFGAGGFLRTRLAKIGIPLVATALTFNLWQDIVVFFASDRAPSLAAYVADGHLRGFFTRGGWQGHLWFLTFLIVYHLAYAAAAPLGTRLAPLPPRLSPAACGNPYLLAVACLVPPALAKLCPALWEGAFGIFTGYHLLFQVPFFAFGALAYHHRAALDAFCRFRAIDLPLLAASFLVAFHLPEPTGTDLDTALQVYANGLCAWLTARLVFVACRQAVSTGRTVRYLSDAAFSVYLSHHFLIVVGGWLLAQFDWPILLEYVALVAASSLVALALHHFVVLRVPLLRLLFNGHWPRPPSARQQPLRPASSTPIIGQQ